MNELIKPSKLEPAFYGGLLLGIASGVPGINLLNCFCCLWVIVGGVLAAYIYQRRCAAPAGFDDAALLGILTGAIGAAVANVVEIPFTLFGLRFIGLEQWRERLEEETDIPPEFRELLVSLTDPSGEFILLNTLIGFFLDLVIFAIFASIGAVIGIAIFRKDSQPTAPPPSPPPVAPPPSSPPPPADPEA